MNAAGQGVDYATGCLVDYLYFKNHYKMIAIDLRKQQAFDADPKAIQHINFMGKLAREGNANTTMLVIIEEAKETNFRYCESIVNLILF